MITAGKSLREDYRKNYGKPKKEEAGLRYLHGERKKERTRPIIQEIKAVKFNKLTDDIENVSRSLSHFTKIICCKFSKCANCKRGIKDENLGKCSQCNGCLWEEWKNRQNLRFKRLQLKRDELSISGAAKDYSVVMKALQQVPDVRQDKINEITQRNRKWELFG